MQIPDNPYGILIEGGSGSGKTNAPLNLIKHQPDVDRNVVIVLLFILKKEILLHFFLKSIKKHILETAEYPILLICYYLNPE